MGISQLLPFIDSIAEEKHLRDFSGQTAAVDGYAWLHRGAKTCAMEMVRGTYTTGFVDYCMKQVELLERNGVTALVVLDGTALPAKAGTEDGRHARRARATAEAHVLLKNGPHEAAMRRFNQAVNITPEHATSVRGGA